MARQTFKVGEKVMIHRWGDQWEEARVIDPDFTEEPDYFLFASGIRNGVKISYMDEASHTARVVRNNRRKILSLEEYAPVAEGVQLAIRARQEQREKQENDRLKRLIAHAGVIRNMVNDTQAEVEIADYLEQHFEHMTTHHYN